jgi:hypothetical protein
MGVITVVSAVGLAAGLALTGAHVANADAGSSPAAAGAPAAAAAPADVTLPSGGVLEKRVTGFCGRVPKLIDRAGKAQTRITGDASTKGSLAWLKARKAKATANGHQRVADRIDRRAERRADRLKKLPEIKQKLAAASNECATLDLPTSTPTPSTSS